jgi:hypothetical protein
MEFQIAGDVIFLITGSRKNSITATPGFHYRELIRD